MPNRFVKVLVNSKSAHNRQINPQSVWCKKTMGGTMIRLLLVSGMAVALWPLDENNQAIGLSKDVPTIEISSADVLGAAYSVISDIGGFCERNTETCVTGQQAFTSVSTAVKARISASQDPITTAGIKSEPAE